MPRGRVSKANLPYMQRREELCAVLKRQRELLKISRKELAARSRISAATIQAIECCDVKDPGLFTVIALGVALQIDLGSMMRSLTEPIRPQPLVASPPITGVDDRFAAPADPAGTVGPDSPPRSTPTL